MISPDLTRKQPSERIPTNAALIQRLKNWQDQASWQDFFDTYWRLIYGMAIKSGLPDSEAQDVVQETLIDVAKRMPNFKYDPALGSFKGWLANIVRWRIGDQFRKRQRQAENLQFDDALITHTAFEPSMVVFETWWDAEWEGTLLEAAINRVKSRLDPQKYQIFDFYVNKGRPAEEVAKTFEISTNQVYLAKHRVTELLKQEAERLKREMI